nr:uncharacterized protein LOC116285585 [Vicugna pacos]
MRLRLTPPDSALPSPAPARPVAGPRVDPCARAAPAHLEGLQGRLACALGRRSPALTPLHLPVRPGGGRESLRGSSSAARLPASRLPHLPPVRPCPLPLSTLGSQGCQAAAGPQHMARWRRLGRAQSGQEVAILWRTLVVPPRPPGTRVFLGNAGTRRARPCGRSAALTGELANGRRGRQHNVERLQNVNTAGRAAGHVCPDCHPPAAGTTGNQLWHPRAARLSDACLALSSSPPAEDSLAASTKVLLQRAPRSDVSK